MGKEIVLFASEEKSDRASVAAFLRELADKVAEGRIVLISGTEELPLELPENVVLEIKAEEEAKKNKIKRSLEVEIEWILGDQGGGGVTLG
ncbi:MAG: amphi-Trp domain-containing protein [Candidatus Promineifilaceae bacterium]